jgi:broad specificity phosphatase PhoE
MKLLFVRHGQTDSNKAGRMQGQEVDERLNETGIAQVRATMEQLPERIDALVSSPLQRARHTAELINEKYQKHIEFSDDIRELRYGSLAGKTWPEIREYTGNPAIGTHKENVTFDYRPYGGEWSEDFKKRVARFVEEMKRRFTHDEVILITAHGGVIDAMHLLFPQKERPPRDNGRIHEFVF